MEPNPQSLSMLRAADAMLHALGGTEVTLRFPGPELEGQPPTTEDVAISPAVVRNLGATNGRRHFEVVLSVRAMAELADLRQAATPQELLDSCLGVVRNGALLSLERVETDIFAGEPYLYRLIVFAYQGVM